MPEIRQVQQNVAVVGQHDFVQNGEKEQVNHLVFS
jgi:hypothetical protein